MIFFPFFHKRLRIFNRFLHTWITSGGFFDSHCRYVVNVTTNEYVIRLTSLVNCDRSRTVMSAVDQKKEDQ